MQYVGRAFDSVSKTWSSINPATLSGAIDIIVVEDENGELNCSPFHVRFGKFQLLRPSQKKVDFIINGKLTNLPMKLGDGGEAFFVFETSKNVDVPNDMMTSPVLSASSSASSSPSNSPKKASTFQSLQEPEFLDINQSTPELSHTNPVNIPTSTSTPELGAPTTPDANSYPKDATSEKFQKLSKRLTMINIPTKIDKNGDLSLDMNGYKSNEQNIHDTDEMIKKVLAEEFGDDVDFSSLVKEDDQGNIKIFSNEDLSSSPTLTDSDSYLSYSTGEDTNTNSTSSTNYVKTLRLTSDQLKFLHLKNGENDLCFSVDKGKALITSKLYLWKYDVPIVISDIDGTITKSDALGHVLTMLGRDWTHPGVAKLFTDIKMNGYNIMYLTARSVGQADSTRSYLRSIDQDGVSLPNGPVILSPDRTIAALKREVILKKPEVFKMACLSDLKNLYSNKENPFYAGFGNRITDALSYRSVNIPSSRIFTINPDGEVHMELLELAGYRSSYVFINELVDHFFPPVNSGDVNDENFTDVNYWREPLLEIEDLSEEEGSEDSTKKITIDDVDKNYIEEEDEDYKEDDDNNDDYDEDEDEEEEEDEEEGEEEDDDFDEDLDDDFDEDADDYDLDDELERNESSFTHDENFDSGNNETEDKHDHLVSGLLPVTVEKTGISLNTKNINGHSASSFVHSSDLIRDLSIEDRRQLSNLKR